MCRYFGAIFHTQGAVRAKIKTNAFLKNGLLDSVIHHEDSDSPAHPLEPMLDTIIAHHSFINSLHTQLQLRFEMIIKNDK